MDLVRPLGLAGIGVAVAAAPHDPVRYSRFTRARTDLPALEDEPGAARALATFATRCDPSPVLFYTTDAHLRVVSRQRALLGEAFSFVVAAAELVEDLVDKARFSALAERLGLDVPPSRAVQPRLEPPPISDLRFPVLLKPLPGRTDRWQAIERERKAVAVSGPEQLRALWERLAAADVSVLAQSLIPGPESRIESYHVYVDPAGDVVAEFTGRKIRTCPPELGHSTALVITDSPDVARSGRSLIERVGLTGVAKADFKRGSDGRLHLLEVNPRFTLWHHLAAVAGLNIPAVVYADLTGQVRPVVRRARPGARWSLPWLDARAVRAQGGSLLRWLRWLAGTDALSVIAWDDPLPFVAGKILPGARELARRGWR